MAYYFMDDYGDQWMITTANPKFNFHRFVELSTDELQNHQVFFTQCEIENPYYMEGSDEPRLLPCFNGSNQAVVWSDIMSKSNAETEAQTSWQETQLTARLRKVYQEMVGEYTHISDEDYFAKQDRYEEYAREQWDELYKTYDKSKGLI